MSDLIDVIRKHKTLYEADHGWDKTTLDALDTAIKALEQPTIEPEREEFPEECQKCVFSVFGIREPERKKGKWIDCDGSEHWKCDKCGCRAGYWFNEENSSSWELDMSEWLSNFCPNCGAEMEGTE